MAYLYADEQFPLEVSQKLRLLGHNVLTVQEAGYGNLGIPDEEVLDFAILSDRAVLTLNRQDFIRLHRQTPNHAGIIVCTNDLDRSRMASRIHEGISIEKTLRSKLIRVIRPRS